MKAYQIKQIKKAVAVCDDIAFRRADWDDIVMIMEKRQGRYNIQYDNKRDLIGDLISKYRFCIPYRPHLLTTMLRSDWSVLFDSCEYCNRPNDCPSDCIHYDEVCYTNKYHARGRFD